MESAASVHWEWGGFMNQDDGFIFKKDVDIRRDGRFNSRWEDLEDTFASAHDVFRGACGAAVADEAALLAAGEPFFTSDLWKDIAEGVDQSPAVVRSRDVDRSAVFLWSGSGEWGVGGFEPLHAFLDANCHAFGFTCKAVRATFSFLITRVIDVAAIERGKASVAGAVIGFHECGIDADALVEDETIAIIVSSAAFFEVFEDASVELINFFKAFIFHERTCFFTADTTGAKHDDWLIFEFLG